MEDLAISIIESVYVELTPMNTMAVTEILNYDDPDRANTICNYLGIEKRGNRAGIRELINKNEK